MDYLCCALFKETFISCFPQGACARPNTTSLILPNESGARTHIEKLPRTAIGDSEGGGHSTTRWGRNHTLRAKLLIAPAAAQANTHTHTRTHDAQQQ